jgi:hypothetical protein
MIDMAQDVEVSRSLAGPGAGEMALMRAVLEDALRCVLGEGPIRDRAERAAEARGWLEDRDRVWPFSFENVCDCLGLCAERLRARVFASAVVIPAPPESDASSQSRRPRRSSPSEREIVEMIRQGQPLRVVAETLGISISKASILSCGLASRIKAERDEEIRALRRTGWTYRALAGRFALSRIRVMRICSRRDRPLEPDRSAA